MATPEKHGFQAEVKQLLKLMIHSLYSNKEIFLRELISNASDAADKLRFSANTNAALLEAAGPLEIRVDFDKPARTITISDNGIGMTRDEVVANIGTIARSGTKEFLSTLSGDQAKDAHLIGQFGVGFYSAFIVAENVVLVTRKAGTNEATRWESAGEGEYTLAYVTRDAPGTTVTLHLRKEEDDFLNDWKLREVIRKYSDHITLPILMHKEEWDEEKKERVRKDEWERVNQAAALWARPKSEISEEQYHEFYKTVAHDFEAPLAYAHNKVEGNREYTQLLYIPARAPFDLWDREHRHGLKLYVKRVFILDDAEHLLPPYLRFVRGVVDSADLPLNVSREILQESRDISALRAACTKRVLDMLDAMAEKEGEKYATFWKEFGRCLKEGLADDHENRERLLKLCRFSSTHTADDVQSVTLKDYVGRMSPEQEKVYFLTADSLTAARSSPHLEVFRKKGVEVLLLTDRIDEWVINHIHEAEGKPLLSVAKGALDLGKLETEDEKKQQADSAETHKALTERIAKSLGDKVKEVRVTHRLTDSPACLVVGEFEMSAHLERMLKAAGQTAPNAKPTLEINPEHALIARLATLDDAAFGDWAAVVHDQALLAEGGALADPAGFVKKLNQIILSISN